MFKNKLKLKNFRIYQNSSFIFNKKINVIFGLNGTGKSTIIEAINFLSYLKSFRDNNEKNLIKSGADFTKMNWENNSKSFEIIITQNTKLLKENKTEIKAASDFVGKIKTILFTPDDLFIFKKTPRERRFFLDMVLANEDKIYLKNLIKNKKILYLRNQILKKTKNFNSKNISYITETNKLLANIFVDIINKRQNIINKINQKINQYYQKISGNYTTTLQVEYFDSLKINSTDIDAQKEEIIFKLYKNLKNDLYYQTTILGPHRDDFKVIFNNKELLTTASQGQIRLVVICIKLSLIEKTTVILLDDVLGELDVKTKKNLINTLKKLENQTIITTTDSNLFPKKFINFIKL